ncbi:MAG TPA: tRNA adenosine(34) deaminase TadA [Actinomycetota bacterium]|nr:tRNA adenosine(34) deaminase TadA [Actinomycetota bacterium]
MTGPASDDGFMRLALQEALTAPGHGDVPVGAVLVRSGEVVARGHNTRDLVQDPSGHAEMSALRLGAERLGTWRLESCEMFVTLEPCPMCAGAIVAARIDRLVFGAWDPKAGACGSLYNIPEDPRLNHRTRVRRGVLADECAEPLARFFGERRAGGGGGGI